MLATFKRLTYWLFTTLLILAPGLSISGEPGFHGALQFPVADIAPYPHDKVDVIISLYYRSLPQFPKRLATKSKVERSSFLYNSLTFGAAWYKSRKYEYYYTSRSVDADDYMEYRRQLTLDDKLREFRAQALSKDQKDKKGGLFQLDIPVKSKAMEAIAGEGGVGLKVSGTHKITFSGRSQWDNRPTTATYRPSKFPSLNMEQISRFDINGTIGTKISVSVSQDSKVNIPLANRLIIRYKGEEDDIIQSIEAGNTTLSLPNTQFVGYSTRIQGLFGIKTEAQIGGLNLTAIASQEKGSTERMTVTAGGKASSMIWRDWQYLDGKIYDLGRPQDFQPGDKIVFIQVYKYERTYQGEGLGDSAIMYVDPDNPDLYPDEKLISIVNPLNPNEYFPDLHVANNNVHTIFFYTPIGMQSGEEIGVYMEIERNGDTVKVGDISETPYKLKLLKHRNPIPAHVTWNYLWRNIYPLGRGYGTEADIDPEALDIYIYKGEKDTEGNPENLNHKEGTSYVTILGLDQTSQMLGEVDTRNEKIVDLDNNLLIFPHRQPFNTDTVYAKSDGLILDSAERVPEIYTETRGQRVVQENTKYYLSISSQTLETTIRLNKTNIIEGSERVTANGILLQRGTDYRIDYNFGKVTLISTEATDANANIAIDFEYTPFILAQKKTLFGIRGEYEFNRDLKFGATFLYKSDKATERRPKIGQETSRMMVWDVDGRFKVNTNFLTKFANALPFYSTEQESNLTVAAEVAQSLPNPNVDGVAYIDDFEGSRDMYSLSVYRSSWQFSSKPSTLSDSYLRGRLLWYNPFEQVRTDSIWDREVTVEQGRSHVLVLDFRPNDLDLRLKIDTPLTVINPSMAWGGITRHFVGGAQDQQNAQLLELRVFGNRGILHIDIGSISEDADGDGQKNTEDINNSRSLTDDEDIGLDGMTDALEREWYAMPDVADPSGDNWNSNDYYYINGPEGNQLDEATNGFWDTEDLGRDGWTTTNQYFSYVIDLSDTLSDFSFYVENSDFNGWKTFRIPLRDESSIDETVGSPSWNNIEKVRFWVESPDGQPFVFKIAAADIVSSIWEDTLVLLDSIDYDAIDTDSLPRFNVAVVNTQENADYKKDTPPGVIGYYDPNTGVTEPEQSLLLHFENFRVYDTNMADTGIAERVLINTPNLLGYRSLKMFVHGPPADVADSIFFFFRIGQDVRNYYEYSRVLDPGWAANEVVIDFDVITGLKEYLLRAKEINPDTSVIDTIIGGYQYRVVGNPNITKVKYLASGVVNLDPGEIVTGDVWIDELRLLDVRRDAGLATRISANGNVADLFSYNGGYSYQNSFFRKISGTTRGGAQNNLGSGSATISYSFGINFRVDRFLPKSLEANIPVSMRYTKNTTRPRLRFNSDIILPEDLRDEESTINTTKGFSISESFGKKTKNPLFTLLLNQAKVNLSYNRSEGRSPAIPMSLGENISSNASYGLSIKSSPGIRPFFWTKPIPILKKLSGNKLYLTPNQFSSSGNFSRNLRITRNSKDVLTQSLKRDFRGNMKISYKVFDNINTNYSMDTKRDLSDPSTFVFSFNPKKFKLGRELSYSQSFGASASPKVFSFLTHSLTYSVAYRENIGLTNDTRSASSTKSYGISGNFDFKKLFASSKRRQRPSERRGQLKENDGIVKVEKEKNILASIINPPRSVLAFLTSWIDPIGYDFKEAYSYSFAGLEERATMKFRFGLTEDIGVALDTTNRTAGRSNAITKNTSYSFRSGTQFFGGLKTDVTFSRSIKQDVKRAVNPSKDISTTFPDINFSIRPLKTITFLNPLIKKFTPQTKYTRSTSETTNMATGIKTSEKASIAQNPLLAFTFDIARGLTIRFNTNKTISEQKRFNASTGDFTNLSRNISKNTTISTKYSFTWPSGIKLPIFGRIRIKSTMSMAIDITMRSQKNEEQQAGKPLTSRGTNKVLMVNPSISYSFSSQITGGMRARWQDTDEGTTNRKVHVRELAIWVDIRF